MGRITTLVVVHKHLIRVPIFVFNNINMIKNFYNKYKVVINWIVLIPAVLLTYGLTKFFIGSGYASREPEMVANMSKYGGFDGHYILGPMYLINKELVAIMFSLYVASILVNKFKKQVVIFISAIYILIALSGVAFYLYSYIFIPGYFTEMGYAYEYMIASMLEASVILLASGICIKMTIQNQFVDESN